MSLDKNQFATVVVIELGVGQVYVKIAEPKPAPQRVEVLLRKTIDAWFNSRPQFVIDREQPVVEAGEILGIQVWYHAEEHREVSPSPEPVDSPASLTIEVSDPLLGQLPKERLEAVVDEAIQVWHSQSDRHGTLIVINARRIAVILEERVSRGAVVPAEEVFAFLDEMARGALQTWMGTLPTRLHVIQIAGSWFEPHLIGWQRLRIAEPGFVRTNMTYDAGKHAGA